MNWTLSQLRTFAAVAELGTMTAAARQLGYTTGAVSQHMAALQRVTHTPLFAPAGRTLVLTSAGRALLPRPQAVLAAESQAAEAVAGGALGDRAQVTLGVFGSASVVAFAPAQALLPDTEIDLRAREVDVEQMQDAVLSGRIDVGIGVDYPSSPLAPQRGVVMRTLRRESFFVAAPGGPEAAQGRPRAAAGEHLGGGGMPCGARLETQELAEAMWIVPPNDSTFGRAVRFGIAELGLAARETHVVTDSAVTLAMVGSGMGLSLATPIMMSLAPASVRLVPGTECGGRRIVVMAGPQARMQPAVARVITALRQVFASPQIPADGVVDPAPDAAAGGTSTV